MTQLLQSLLLSVQKFVLPKRMLIIRLLNTLSILVVVGCFTAFGIAQNDFSLIAPLVYQSGGLLGVTALILYILTLLPGIITRLKWWVPVTMPISSILTPFRRQLGILMFVVAYTHMAFATTLPQLVMFEFDPSKIILETYEWMGSVAFWVLFPLWLTSNDLSQRFMGKWWKRLHRLTYVSLFFIFLHVALQLEGWSVVIAGVALLEIVSWMRVWNREKITDSSATQKTVVPQEPTQS